MSCIISGAIFVVRHRCRSCSASSSSTLACEHELCCEGEPLPHTFEPEHCGGRAFLLDMCIIFGSGYSSRCLLLLLLNLGQLLVEPVQLRFALRDVRTEDIQLRAANNDQKGVNSTGMLQLPLLCNRSLQFAQVVLIRVLDLRNVCLLLFELCHYLCILFAEIW